MPETSKISVTSEPTATVDRPAGGTAITQNTESASNSSVDFPDFTPLMDVAEGRISFLMDAYENSVRSVMFVSAAGLECGTIWTRGYREIGEVAANSLWKSSQTALEASAGLVESWMDLNTQAMDATAARLTETA